MAARRRPGRHARVSRRFTPRRWLPFVLLVAVVGAAVYVSERVSPTDTREVTVSAPETLLPVAAVPDPISATWFCGGGTAVGAGERADLSFVIANAADEGASATVTVFGGEAAPRSTTVDVPVNGRVRVRARDVRPGEWAAATVEVFGGRATVERQVDGPDGFEASPCASAASSTWYLPSGSTLRGAVLHLALFNPFPDPTSVDVEFATDEGPIAPQALTGLAIPARSLRVVTVENPSRRAEVAATITTRTGRIVVDRLQTFDGSGDPVTGEGPDAIETEAPRGIASSPGLATAAPAWFFPDVRIVQGGRTQLALLNPSTERAELEVTAGFDDPARYTPLDPIEVTVGAGEQTVLDLTDRLEFTPGMELTLRVRSVDDVDVVAELVWFTGERDTQPEPSEGDPDAVGETDPDAEADPDATTTTAPATTGTTEATGTTGAAADDRVPEADPDEEDPDQDPEQEQELSFTVYAPGFAVTAGAPVAARSWFVPGRGANDAVTAQVVVANPSGSPVRVTVDELVGGSRQPLAGATVEVPAGGRATVSLDEAEPGSALVIDADGPIVVGRTQWATTGRGISTDLATPFPDQVVPLSPLVEQTGAVLQVLIVAVLVAVAVAVSLVLRRRDTDAPEQGASWVVPTQLDRADFERPEAPWLVVVFSSTTCLACQGAVDKAMVLEAPAVAVQSVDSVADRALHQRYQVDAVPMVLVADALGQVHRSFVGEPTATDLWAALAELREPGSVPPGCGDSCAADGACGTDHPH